MDRFAVHFCSAVKRNRQIARRFSHSFVVLLSKKRAYLFPPKRTFRGKTASRSTISFSHALCAQGLQAQTLTAAGATTSENLSSVSSSHSLAEAMHLAAVTLLRLESSYHTLLHLHSHSNSLRACTRYIISMNFSFCQCLFAYSARFSRKKIIFSRVFLWNLWKTLWTQCKIGGII